MSGTKHVQASEEQAPDGPAAEPQDVPQQRLHAARPGLDVAEPEADRAEPQADSAEPQADSAEPKDDSAEPKAGQAETGAPAAATRPPRRTRQSFSGTPSLDELIEAFQEKGRPSYPLVRRLYQKEHGTIHDNFYARGLHAGVLLVRPPRRVARWSKQRAIQMRYAGSVTAGVQPEFEATVWRARAMERQSGLILAGRTRKVLVERVFVVLVYLVSVLDATVGERDGGGTLSPSERKRVHSALMSVRRELDRLDEFAAAAAKRASLGRYLAGLPLGLAVVLVPVLLAKTSTWSLDLVGVGPQIMATCLMCGAIGGVLSVMIRVTRGQRLSIDSEQGPVVTTLAGSFRPLIGAVFGIALYVFVSTGLVPVAVPAGDPLKQQLFFAGLAFLAGFNERWAQDSIVQSAPTRSLPPAHGGAAPATTAATLGVHDEPVEDGPDEGGEEGARSAAAPGGAQPA